MKEKEQFIQVNIIVDDIHKAAKAWAALLGVHHLGFEVGDDRDKVIKELKAMGFDTERTIGVYPGSSWTIVDTEDVLGVNLNIKPKR